MISSRCCPYPARTDGSSKIAHADRQDTGHLAQVGRVRALVPVWPAEQVLGDNGRSG
jgi:hypothetical protein